MKQTHWQDFYHGNAPVHLSTAAVFKAGEGLAFTDPQYVQFVAQAEAEGHHAMAYYALHPGAPVQQATRAQRLIGARPAMFDCEHWPPESGSPGGMVTVPEICQAVAAYRQAGGTMHVIYLPRSMWELMGSPGLNALSMLGLFRINADYRAGAEVPGSAAWDSYGGMPTWAVQYAPCHNTAVGTWADAWSVWQNGHALAPVRARVVVAVQGDSFDGIAARYGLTPGHLHALNPQAGHPAGNLDLIYPGDRFVIQP